MLTEFMPKRSSSGVAVNNFIRNIFSSAFTVAAQPLLDALGNGWVFTILGLITWVAGYACILSIKRFGSEWRKSMDEKLNS
jgi:hypothetical protein